MEAQLTHSELNAAALDRFVYQPVNETMVRYLANAAFNVIACDSNLMPTPMARTGTVSQPASAPTTPEPHRVKAEDGGLPTLKEFITQLVRSSNVQVPTLMSTLVYLTRLRSRLQPMARGLRCTTHRIFLAALILAAKYLNDSSPKNKHWANYSHLNTNDYSFGFSRTEVNLMEKQLLFLLDWDLRITEEDLYRELEPFLAPIRDDVQLRHSRLMYRRRIAAEDKMRQQAAAAAAAAAAASAAIPQPPQDIAYSLPTPPQSRDHSRDRLVSGCSTFISTPPELSYSSSAGTPGSTPTSHMHSRSHTPLSYVDGSYMACGPVTDVVVMIDEAANSSRKNSAATLATSNNMVFPYEMTPEPLEGLQADGKPKGVRRSVLGRVLSAVSVR